MRGKTGHKAHNFRTVARQPALTWQAVCTHIAVRGIKCDLPSMITQYRVIAHYIYSSIHYVPV